MPAIEVSHLTKEYRLGALQGLKQTLLNTGARLMGKHIPERPLFKALDDVSLTIEQGEVVGIIGHNGAGKSTLLKMLAGISTPTHGSVKVNGRIAPLIEVGAGFIPDFTGRENVYLNGSILGLSRKEIDKKFDEIVDFAEIAEFIDTPVKRYSSGMQVKLAFAVATSVEAEILIVDEVLAVGDLAFQRKCVNRMSHLINDSGRTVLFVSHNIRHIEQICTRALLLDKGKLLGDDVPTQVCTQYYERTDENVLRKLGPQTLSQDDNDIIDVTIALINGAGSAISSITYREEAIFSIRFHNLRPLHKLTIGVGIQTADRLNIATQGSGSSLSAEPLAPGKHEIIFKIQDFPLLPGPYTARLGITVDNIPRTIYYGESLVKFKVQGHSHIFTTAIKDEGFLLFDSEWTLNHETGN